MNTETSPPVTATAKPKRKTRKPRGPRTVDPDVVAIRKAATEQVAALYRRRRSAAILKTLVDKRLGQMVEDDLSKLHEELGKRITPKLPSQSVN